MSELLALPEIQSAAAPLTIALLMGWIVARATPLAPSVAVAAGFVATALLLNGLDFETLTAARKIILAIVAAALVGIVFDALKKSLPLVASVGLALAAAAWIFGAVLLRGEGLERVATMAGVAACVAWLVFSMQRLNENGLRAGGASLALGLGTGGAAIIGSSALLGQLALGIGAASGGYILLLLLMRRNDCGATLSFPVAVGAATLACAAAIFAELKWVSVALLALVPLAARYVPVRETWPRIVQAGVIAIASSAVAVTAVAAAWLLSNQDSSGY